MGTKYSSKLKKIEKLNKKLSKTPTPSDFFFFGTKRICTIYWIIELTKYL